MEHLGIMLSVLQEKQLLAKLSKCDFWMTEVKFIGHAISQEGVSVDLSIVGVVVIYERLKNSSKIQRFLGTAGYYIRFNQGFSQLALPMTHII